MAGCSGVQVGRRKKALQERGMWDDICIRCQWQISCVTLSWSLATMASFQFLKTKVLGEPRWLSQLCRGLLISALRHAIRVREAPCWAPNWVCGLRFSPVPLPLLKNPPKTKVHSCLKAIMPLSDALSPNPLMTGFSVTLSISVQMPPLQRWLSSPTNLTWAFLSIMSYFLQSSFFFF